MFVVGRFWVSMLPYLPQEIRPYQGISKGFGGKLTVNIRPYV